MTGEVASSFYSMLFPMGCIYFQLCLYHTLPSSLDTLDHPSRSDLLMCMYVEPAYSACMCGPEPKIKWSLAVNEEDLFKKRRQISDTAIKSRISTAIMCRSLTLPE